MYGNGDGISQSSTISVATDSAGNIYETGWYIDTIHLGPNVFFTPNDSLTSQNGFGCVFLAKYDPNGNVLWARTGVLPYSIFGSNNQKWTLAQAIGYAVSTDRKGNVYMAGQYYDTVSFGPYTLSSNSHNGNYNSFLVKYDANGNLKWAKGSMAPNDSSYGYTVATSISTDRLGNIYMAGYCRDTTYFGANLVITPNGALSAFLIKYDSNGNIVWIKISNSPSRKCYAKSYGVTTDYAGNIYVTGAFLSNAKFGSITLTSPYNNSNEYVVKYDPNGSVLWAYNASAPSSLSFSTGNAISADSAGNTYVTGDVGDTATFGPTTVIDGLDAYLPNSYLVKYDPNGNVGWIKTSVLSSSSCYGYGLAVSTDIFGHVYETGQINDTLVFGKDTLTATFPISIPGDGMFLLKYDSTGNLLCASSLPSGGSYTAGLATDRFGNAYIGSRVQRVAVNGPYMVVGPDTLYCYWDNQVAYIAKYVCCKGYTGKLFGAQNICNGSKVTLDAIGGGTYVWSTGQTTDSISVSPESTTNYSVAISYFGCKDTLNTTVNVYSFSATACCNTSILKGQNTILNVSPANNKEHYTWVPGTGLSCDTCPDPVATPTITTTYFVTVTDSEGCSRVDTITIEVLCGQVFVPDAFSPNADGQNDILYVRSPCINTMEFEVFDRWGNKVFESQNVNRGWDGTYNGQPMNTGTYAYYLYALMLDGSITEKHGNISLVR